jgi:hypothetical protein
MQLARIYHGRSTTGILTVVTRERRLSSFFSRSGFPSLFDCAAGHGSCLSILRFCLVALLLIVKKTKINKQANKQKIWILSGGGV